MAFLPPYYRYIALFFYRFILHFAVVKTTFCRNTLLSFFYSFCFSLSEWITTLVRWIEILFDVTVSDECLKRHIAENYNTSMHLLSDLVNLLSY